MNYTIRTAEIADAQAVHDIYSYYVENTCVTFSQVTAPVESYEESIKDKHYPFIVAEDENGRVIGFASGSRLRPHDAYIWNVESSIYLTHDCPRRTGIGEALYIEFMDRCSKMGYKYVYGVIEDSNEPSIQFHEKLGFAKVGHFTNIGFKFDKWRGIVWYQKQIGDLNDMNLRVDD